MALTDFKPQFDNAYEEIFQKVIVSKEIANTRFKPTLSYGESVERVAYDISSVQVRSTVRGAASTIDSITDGSELLTINLEKELVFHISDGEVKQAGPLNPGEVIGGQCAIKLAVNLDGYFFAEVLNAAYTFDNGDLTTLSSDGTPFAESSTTVPQMVSMMPAKLRRQNQTLSNLCFVTDSFGAGLMTQYLLGKSIDLAGSVYANGYTGDVSNAKMYVSENLTGTATLALPDDASDADTVTINGVVFTAKTALTPLPGEFIRGVSADDTRANLTDLINNPLVTTAKKVALSAADAALVSETYGLSAVNDNGTNLMALTGRGSGALTVSQALTPAADIWSLNCIHAYFGKKGAIDMVVQDIKEVDMRATADRRGTNVFSSYLAGIKTFVDGSKKFLNVKLAR